MTAALGFGPDGAEIQTDCSACMGTGEVSALGLYLARVRDEWRSSGKAQALAWIVAAGIIVALAMFAALAGAINA